MALQASHPKHPPIKTQQQPQIHPQPQQCGSDLNGFGVPRKCQAKAKFKRIIESPGLTSPLYRLQGAFYSSFELNCGWRCGGLIYGHNILTLLSKNYEQRRDSRKKPTKSGRDDKISEVQAQFPPPQLRGTLKDLCSCFVLRRTPRHMTNTATGTEVEIRTKQFLQSFGGCCADCRFELCHSEFSAQRNLLVFVA